MSAQISLCCEGESLVAEGSWLCCAACGSKHPTPPRVIVGDVFHVDLPRHHYALVYADPPYAGCRARYARGNNSRQWGRNARADFMRDLIARMNSLRRPDGVCAVSMGTPELELLPLFPSKRRVFAWVKPSGVPRPNVWPTHAWECVVAWGQFPAESNITPPLDWLELSPRVTPKTRHETPKPLAFAEWLYDLALGTRIGPICELFAGTAPMSRVASARGCEATAVDLTDYLSEPAA